MFKQLLIGIFAMSVVAILWTDANAGCAVIGGKRACAPWITGGSAVGVVTANFGGNNQDACPAVQCEQGDDGESNSPCGPAGGDSFTSGVTIDLRLAGTDGSNCGLGSGNNDSCGIKGVVFCGAATTSSNNDDDDDDDDNGPKGKTATTISPLTVFAPGFAQADGSGHNFASFRFQLSTDEQDRLCPNSDKPYITFIPREGFFEACVDDTGGISPVCVRERCSVNVSGLRPEDVRVYSCRPVRSSEFQNGG